jgi:hypothetical protein
MPPPAAARLLQRRVARPVCLGLAALGLGMSAASADDALDSAEAADLASAPSVAAINAALPGALTERIVTIVDKSGPSPIGDPREYVSYGRYWWPDPSKPDGLPFLQRDGHSNEAQVRQGDEGRLGHLAGAVDVLALGWTRLHRDDSARRAGDWLRAWFITPATRMKPDLDYAQVHLGHAQNRGNPPGVLDGRVFASLVADMARLPGSPALNQEESAEVRSWFGAYLHWLLTSPSGRGEHAALNNHGSWYLYQTVAIARYLGEEETARRLCAEDRARIADQVRPDGSQPLELRRADGLWYSFFNLQAQFNLARFAAPLGIDLVHFEAPDGASLSRAVAYLLPYNADPKKWPGHELKALPPRFLDSLLTHGGKP